MNPGTIRMLLRPAPGNAAAVVIPATAFAIVTALVLTVVGGAQSFWIWSDPDAVVYQMLAAVALVLLVVPLVSLGGAAARLAARRRDERLSTLRLLGVTPSGVGVLTVIESTVIAAAGVVVGVIGHLALAPLVGMIPFRGAALGTSSVLLAPALLIAVGLGAVVLAAVSAVLGLRRVIVSPLGVRLRSRPAKVHWLRAVLAAAVLGFAFLLTQGVSSLAAVMSVTVVVAGAFGCALAVLNIVGPWALKIAARMQVRKADTPVSLLAARSVLDDPKAAWRQVGGVAMASFLAVFAGTGVALMHVMSAPEAPAQDRQLITDMRTGLIITLVATFLMVAASVGVTQASDILDQRPLHRSLHQLGMTETMVDAARRRAIMSPLLLTAIGSALCASIVVLPLVGVTLVTAPLSLLTVIAVLFIGILTVWVSTFATRSLLRPAFTG